MKSKLKFKYKNLAKTCRIMGLVLLVILVLSSILLTWRYFNVKTVSENDLMLIGLYLVALFSLGIIFDSFRIYYLEKLRDYKSKIVEYRLRVMVNKVLDLISENKLNEAIKLFKTCVDDKIANSFFTPFFLGMLLNSNDENDNEKAKLLMGEVRKMYDPEMLEI